MARRAKIEPMPPVVSELPVDFDTEKPSSVSIPLGDGRVLELRKKLLFEGSVCLFYGGSHKGPEGKVEKAKPKVPTTRFDHLFLDDEDEGVGPGGVEVVVKLARDSADNDLVEHEVQILQELFPLGDQTEELIYYRFVPKSFGGLKINGRAAHILSRVGSSYYPVAQVLQAFPNGIDYQDVVWMIRRMLMGLGYAHSRGVIHGAVLPNHAFLDLHNHAALFLDWCFSTRGTRITAKHNGFDDYYAPEILQRRDVVASTDIYMMAKCAVSLLGGKVQTNELPDTVPPDFQKLLRECLDPSPRMRPESAWDLHDEFGKLMGRLVGKPKFRVLEMPVTKETSCP
jgi:serine/threonine protein kinase